MQDYIYLIIVLFLIYFLECVILINKGSIIISSRLIKGWVYNFLDKCPQFLNKLLFLCNPIPFLSKYFVSNQITLEISPQGLFNGVNYYLFDEINSINCFEKKIYINKNKFLSLSSSSNAKQLVSFIKEALSLPIEKREQLIENSIKKSFNTHEIESKYKDFSNYSWPLQLFSNILLFYLFLLIPYTIYINIFKLIWDRVLILLAFLMAANLIFFFIAHLKLYKNQKSERWSIILSMLFSPPLAIRSIDYLSKNLFDFYHPLAVAKVLMKNEDFNSFSYKLIRLISYPKKKDQGHANDISNWYHHKLLQFISSEFLTKQELEISKKPPIKENNEITSYCPRCYSQYLKESGLCKDCEIDLIQYNQEKRI